MTYHILFSGSVRIFLIQNMSDFDVRNSCSDRNESTLLDLMERKKQFFRILPILQVPAHPQMGVRLQA